MSSEVSQNRKTHTMSSQSRMESTEWHHRSREMLVAGLMQRASVIG
jgi:hypothetical protein